MKQAAGTKEGEGGEREVDGRGYEDVKGGGKKEW
jgi:hypothetical protein